MSLIRRFMGWDRESSRTAIAVGDLSVLGPGGSATASGVFVGEESSLRLTPVLAAIRILSNSVAMLPLPVYRRIRGGKVREYSHPLYRILQEQANPEMTAFELRRWLMQGAVGWGNGYAWLEWGADGELQGMWPMRPDRTTPVRRDGLLVYRYTLESGLTTELPAYQVLHVRGMTLDGLEGISPIRQLMREAIGLGLAAQEFGARFYSNGARPGGVLEHPGQLTDKSRKNLKESWAGSHQGVANAHRMRILEEGMKYHEIGIPPDEAQFIETRKFQVTEIARAFGVPPHLLGDLDRATFSNIEHQAIEFAQYSLQPWMTQIEQAVNAKCLVGPEEKYLFVEHVTEALVKTDIKTRYEAHQIAILTGFETPNEARAAENRNPLTGGDVLLQPLNMAPLGTKPQQVDTETKSVNARAQGSQGRKELQLQGLIDIGAQREDEDTENGEPSDAETRGRGEAQRRATAEASADRQWVAVIVEDGARRLARREWADKRRGRAGFEQEIADAAVDVFRPVAKALGKEEQCEVVRAAVGQVVNGAAVSDDERTEQIVRAVMGVLEGVES